MILPSPGSRIGPNLTDIVLLFFKGKGERVQPLDAVLPPIELHGRCTDLDLTRRTFEFTLDDRGFSLGTFLSHHHKVDVGQQ